jgi:hypothetical protein
MTMQTQLVGLNIECNVAVRCPHLTVALWSM